MTEFVNICRGCGKGFPVKQGNPLWEIPSHVCERTAPMLPDSGKREEFSTGSVRDTREGKGRYELLPPLAMRELALHFEDGAKKYGDNNWLKGQPVSRYLDSALRHTFSYLYGNTTEDHLRAAAWNLVAALETRERARICLLPKELDDVCPRDQD